MASVDRFRYRRRTINVFSTRVFINTHRFKRGSSTRQMNTGRAYFHSNNQQSSEINRNDDSNTTIRPSLSSSSTPPWVGQSQVRPTDSEWDKKNQYNKRPITNWVQKPDDSKESRSTDTNRNESLENGDNSGGEKRRRAYIWDVLSDGELPEWALENSEVRAGSFDSSGTFHEYRNDDINLPKSSECSYPLSKPTSSFTQSKRRSDEVTENLQTSENAKNLSQKGFDANNIKFKKVPNNDGTKTGTTNKDARTFKLVESLGSSNEQMANKSEDEEMLNSMFNMSLEASKKYYYSNLINASITRGDRDNVAMAMSQLSNPVHMVKNIGKTDRIAVKPNHSMIQSGMPSGLSTLNKSGFGSNMMQPYMAELSGFQGNSIMPNMPNTDGNNSLFFNQNNNGMNNPVDLQYAPHQLGQNMYSMHGMQQSNPQAAPMYNTMMQQTQENASQSNEKLCNEWYYEDPKKIIHGPFSSKEMYNWYLAGFFGLSLMVRRACELGMRPLRSYGLLVPFVQMDMSSPTFAMPGFEQQMPRAPDNMMNTPSVLGNNMRSPWARPGLSADYVRVQQAMNNNNNMPVNNLPPFLLGNQERRTTIVEDEKMKKQAEVLRKHQQVRNTCPPYIPQPLPAMLNQNKTLKCVSTFTSKHTNMSQPSI